MNIPALPFQAERKTVWSFVKHYTYGCFARSFNGAIVAMDAFLGLAAGSAISGDIAKPNWQAAVAVFGVSFIRSALMFFRENPLPSKLPDVQITQETTIVQKSTT